MTENPYEIPAEIRELTEKSIEEARKAFESFIEAASIRICEGAARRHAGLCEGDRLKCPEGRNAR